VSGFGCRHDVDVDRRAHHAVRDDRNPSDRDVVSGLGGQSGEDPLGLKLRHRLAAPAMRDAKRDSAKSSRSRCARVIVRARSRVLGSCSARLETAAARATGSGSW